MQYCTHPNKEKQDFSTTQMSGSWYRKVFCFQLMRQILNINRPVAWKRSFQATGRQHRGCIIPQAVTQSSAPEDGRDHRPKNVELIGIITKPLLLHLVGCLYYYKIQPVLLLR